MGGWLLICGIALGGLGAQDAWIDFAGRTRETYQWVTKVGGTDAAQLQVTTYTYNPTDGRLLSIKPPADEEIQVVSDLQGRITATTQGSRTTSRTLNALGWELTSTDV